MSDKEPAENVSPWVHLPGSQRLRVVEPERGPKSTVSESPLLRDGERNEMAFDVWPREHNLCLWPPGLSPGPVMEQADGGRV